MPNPDLRKSDADPNDPTNIHSARAESGYAAPPRSGGSGGWVVALVAVVAIAAIGYFVFANTDGTQVAEGPAPVVEGDENAPSVTITPPAEEPATDEGSQSGATDAPAPAEDPATDGSTEGAN